jgi:hypothetical protein
LISVWFIGGQSAVEQSQRSREVRESFFSDVELTADRNIEDGRRDQNEFIASVVAVGTGLEDFDESLRYWPKGIRAKFE